MKRVIYAILVIVITYACGGFIEPAQAKYSGGSGEPNNPYQVANVADLMTLANDANDYNKCFIMTADIDLDPCLPGNKVFTTAVIARDNNNESWGFDGNSFTGVFNGLGHKVTNLTIDANGTENWYLGLFGSASDAEITNLGIEDVFVISGDDSYYLGGLLGVGYHCTISNCYVEGAVTGGNNSSFLGGLGNLIQGGVISYCRSTANVTGGNQSRFLGGLIGSNGFDDAYGYDAADIIECNSTGNVSGGNGSIHLGGLVGINMYCTIINCYSTGAVTSGDDSYCLGGLLGDSPCNINNSYSTGPVNSGNHSSDIGGLVGLYYFGSMSSCYSTGPVISGNNSNDIGGLVGDNMYGNIIDCNSSGNVTVGDNSSELGGLLGYCEYGGISNCHSTANVTVGIDSGYIGGLVGYTLNSDIINCYSTGAVGGNQFVAGLVGRTYYTTINDCYSTGNISGGSQIGGLVGYTFFGSISHCYSTGTIIGNRYVGGLVGANSNVAISSCYSSRTVIGVHGPYSSDNLGGLVGQNYGTISNCYATGDVTGTNYEGSCRYGGLVGNNSSSSIRNCYSIGVVTGGDGSYNLGGLIGLCAQGDINSCYFLDVAGPNNGCGTPLTDAQMKQQASFIGWDFSNVWRICEGFNYPRLNVFGKYSGGSGDSVDPFHIATPCDILSLANEVNDYNKCIIMTSDIDLSGYTFTTAVIARDINNEKWGFDGNFFTGVFDGDNHRIKNLTINALGNKQSYLGLFGDVCQCEIKNLGLENVYISSEANSRYIGCLIGSNDHFSPINNNVHNCYSTGSIVCGSNSDFVGGLAGWNNGNITGSFSTVTVTCGNNSGPLGGLIGVSKGSVIDCVSKGSVSGGDNSMYIGGFIGDHYFSVSNCYSSGNVTVGNNSQYIGGFIGHFYLGSITNCYFLSDSGPNNGFGTPLTDSQMKQQASFVGWDFVWETANGLNDIWAICEGVSYPKLAWQYVIGDSDSDKDVDFIDFAPFGNKWMQADSTLYCGGNDLTGDGFVDLEDLDAFVENWLLGL